MTAWAPKITAAAAGLLLASCAASGPPLEDLQPGQKPSNDSLEAGLWMQMSRAEEELKTSGRLVENSALNSYVRGVVCKLEPEICNDVRVYIVRAAGFNATMAPNGTMSVYTGAILRARNEAQLAFILSHEITHYVKRHSLQRWRDIRAKTDGLVFFQVATAMVGVGIIGSAAAIATYGSIMSFSRDQESEADRFGLERMVRAGYDPREAEKVWADLIEEKDALEEEETSVFYATHPQSEKRQEALAALAEDLSSPGLQTGREKFFAVTGTARGEWLRDELRTRQFERFHVLLDHLSENNGISGEIAFYRGEAHRLEGGEEAQAKAIEAYEHALKSSMAPPEVNRSLGLVYWSMKRTEDAHNAFKNYLAAKPDAEDAQMIQYYLERTP